MKNITKFLEPAILVSAILVFSMLWTFWEIAESVRGGGAHEMDKSLLLLLQNPDMKPGPAWFRETMRDVTSLGGSFFLWSLAITVALYFMLAGNGARAAYLVASVAIATLIANILKMGFDRPRPDLIPHTVETYTSSFPSSHSMLSAFLFLSLGCLLANARRERFLKIYFMGVAALLTLIVGISRVYLGVHWPSDVFAGWICGALGALLFWFGDRFISKRAKRDGPAQNRETAA